MAKPPKVTTPEDDSDNPLLKTMRRLVARALDDRQKHQTKISDVYKYTMPWRHKFNETRANVDLDEVFDELPGTILEDFSADMLNTFTPQKNNWLEEKPVETLDSGDKRILDPILKKRQRIVFDAMAQSNLYQSLQQAYLDLGPGTMALIITDIAASQPIHCECIPSPDLLLARGPYGTVSPFRRKTYLRSEIKVMWKDADLNKLGPEPADGADQEYEVTDGCWRDWDNKADEVYHYLVEAQGKILYQKTWKGAGSCPFIVARWSCDPTTAWGIGPTYRTLPAIKTRNHVRYLSLKNYDKHVDPITSYEDDGIINLDQGVEPGTWLPRAAGSEAPESIESKARFDVQVFEMDQLATAIKRAHYQDRPEQPGKTPPTAFQWADERAERARRMGTPATNLVQELQIPIYKRFIYLLDQRGLLKDANPKIDGRVISIQPVSPLLRAQEQEEVIRLDRFAEMLGTRFGPQIAMVVIDTVKFAHRLAELLGVDAEYLRNEQQIADAIQKLMPILQSVGGAGIGGDVAAPAAGLVQGQAA